jgi:hypothetical protein
VGERVATGDGLALVGLWAAALIIFFSHDVKVIIERLPYFNWIYKIMYVQKTFYTKRTDL